MTGCLSLFRVRLSGRVGDKRTQFDFSVVVLRELVALLVAFCACAPTFGEDWPCWRGPERNGISREDNWNDSWSDSGPVRLWKADVGIGFSSMTIANGRVYTIGNTEDVDSVVCLDTLSGKVLWKHSYACPLDDKFFEGGPTSTPTIDGDTVFVLSRTGEIKSLKASSGEVQWSKNLPSELGVDVPGWGFAGSALVLGDQLILSVGQSGTALHKSTGDVVWQSEGEAGYMTPFPIQTSATSSVIIASGKFYHAVDPVTGSVQWRQRWLTTFGCNAADPIAQDGRLFISSGYNRGSALLELNGDAPRFVWETKDFQNQWSSSILVDGFLYGVDGNETGDRSLKCVELKSGEIRWSVEGFGSASLFAAGKNLVLLTDQGELVVAPASPEAFRSKSRAQVLAGKCWTVPVLANGLIYCRNAEGELVCLDVRK